MYRLFDLFSRVVTFFIILCTMYLHLIEGIFWSLDYSTFQPATSEWIVDGNSIPTAGSGSSSMYTLCIPVSLAR